MGAGAGSVNFWASRQIAVYGASPAAAQTAPSLGAAQRFAVLGASTVTNTGASVITGDLGVSPGTAVTGFPPGLVASGTIHSADAAALAAQDAVTAAYNSLVGQACTQDLTGQDLGGQTLTAGVYCFSSSAQLTGTLTLDAQGNANAVFIFKMGSTLTTASASSVVLINGGSRGQRVLAGRQFGDARDSHVVRRKHPGAGEHHGDDRRTRDGPDPGAQRRRDARYQRGHRDQSPASAVTTTVGGAQTTGSGVSFWDVGTLAARLQAGIGTRVLSAVDASLAWANPSLLTFGDLNLLGLTNPLASLVPKSLMYGRSRAGRPIRRSSWGTSIQDPQGVAHHLGHVGGARRLSGTRRTAATPLSGARSDPDVAGFAVTIVIVQRLRRPSPRRRRCASTCGRSCWRARACSSPRRSMRCTRRTRSGGSRSPGSRWWPDRSG